MDLELPEAVESGGSEPAIELLGGGDDQATQVDGEAAAGSRVRGEDAGDVSGEVGPPWLVEVDVEGSRAP
jgi:hypothetical protein